MIEGKVDQKISISSFSSKNRVKLLAFKGVKAMPPEIKRIKIRIPIQWSWKKFNLSIEGDPLFWRKIACQIGIYILFN